VGRADGTACSSRPRASYVVSPGALGPVAVDPNREVDRLSASYLIALAHGSSARWRS